MRVQYKFENYQYVDNGVIKTFETLEKEALEAHKNWKKENLIARISVSAIATLSFSAGVLVILGGFLKAAYLFKAAPLLYCPLGILIIALTVAAIWNGHWTVEAISIYFLPHFMKMLKDFKAHESENFIALYLLFVNQTVNQMTPVFVKDLEAIFSMNLAIYFLNRAKDETSLEKQKTFYTDAQSIGMNCQLDLPFFTTNKGAANFMKKLATDPEQVANIVFDKERIEDSNFDKMVKAVQNKWKEPIFEAKKAS